MNKVEKVFADTVWDYYNSHSRNMPWRENTSPYYIWLSEIMLQQTQVERVVPKFIEFITQFPDVHALANASLEDVLRVWKGLGYNRRAKFVLESAKIVKNKYNGSFPDSLEELIALPGVGKNTAGAILAYVHNAPVVFIETNIRTVYIHHFFTDKNNVSDKEILELVKTTLDTDNPREWYWALMDYGSNLKKTVKNNTQSKSYVKQARFSGSKRELRGKILDHLLDNKKSFKELYEHLKDDRLEHALQDLQNEKMIKKSSKTYSIEN